MYYMSLNILAFETKLCEWQKRQVREGKSIASSKIYDNINSEEESVGLQLEGKVSLEELMS